ncbi:MAG: YfiR family protein [Limisphaerales bacterium]
MTRHFNQQPAPAGRLRRGRARLGVVCRVGLLIGAVSLSLLTGIFSAGAEEEMPADFQVKAAFLINFPKYVDWPASAFAETNSPITIAVYGDDNVATEVQNMIGSGRMVGGHPVILKRITKDEEINRDCHILFIGASERQRIPSILEKIRGKKILTVSESDDFLAQDGIINLARQGRKIRLQVNLTAAGSAQLKISSRLLVAADVVKGKSN